jgi:RIO-like serine/threonine protein kinase
VGGFSSTGHLILHKSEPKLLKKDVFGEVWLGSDDDNQVIIRDVSTARVWIRWLARSLMAREAAALAALDKLHGVPKLLRSDKDKLVRSYVRGSPMHLAKPTDRHYFAAAAALLRRMHRAGVVHNDLAKEPNILVDLNGNPAFIDFQLAWFSRRRNRFFRMLGREDVRHLLKHKRTYCSQHLTALEKKLLSNPSVLSRIWMKTVKPIYLFVTRRIMGWSDREGAADRSRD